MVAGTHPEPLFVQYIASHQKSSWTCSRLFMFPPVELRLSDDRGVGRPSPSGAEAGKNGAYSRGANNSKKLM